MHYRLCPRPIVQFSLYLPLFFLSFSFFYLFLFLTLSLFRFLYHFRAFFLFISLILFLLKSNFTFQALRTMQEAKVEGDSEVAANLREVHSSFLSQTIQIKKFISQRSQLISDNDRGTSFVFPSLYLLRKS